jgi:hypothetical protein
MFKLILLACFTSSIAFASDHGSEHGHSAHDKPAQAEHKVKAPEIPVRTTSAGEITRVVAMEPAESTAILTQTILTSKGSARTFIDQRNVKIQMAPHSAGEFTANGEFKLYRGSAYYDSSMSVTTHTTNASVDFVGQVFVTYDYKEKSSSAFVVKGEARVKNPSNAERFIRLEKNQGATMLSGDVYPNMIRGLDITKVDSWLAGYGWSANDRSIMLASVPAQQKTEPERKPATTDSRLVDYFSSIQADEDEERPHYYEDKYELAMTGTLDSNPYKPKLAPESAAMIVLPDTKIDKELFTEILDGSNEMPVAVMTQQKSVDRKPAGLEYVDRPTNRKVSAVKPVKKDSQDADVQNVLDRLNNLAPAPHINAQKSRAPASVAVPVAPKKAVSHVVADPVYDFSENF